MFNWLTPLTSILAETSAPISAFDGKQTTKPSGKPLLHTFLHAPPPVLLDLVNGFADDTATLSKLGLIGKRTGERAGNFANWCWFASTLVNLVENQVERSIIVNSQRAGMLFSYFPILFMRLMAEFQWRTGRTVNPWWALRPSRLLAIPKSTSRSCSYCDDKITGCRFSDGSC